MPNNTDLPLWIYNEFQASGVDYADLSVVRNYENRHRRFRDFDAEFERICKRTGLSPNDSVLDLGCGSGAFVIPAAKYCRQVYGADVSRNMLTLLQEKLDEQKLENVRLYHAGFLTFGAIKDSPEQFDVIISSIALHHLPDFWKAVALQRVAELLKPDGVFYLYDVVFTFPVPDWQESVQRILNEMETAAGQEANKHISSEYSIFSWYLEGIFERVGLKVEQIIDDNDFLRAYVCRKVKAKETPVLSVNKVRAIDANAAERFDVPTVLLMENAARSLADVFVENAPKLNGGRVPRRVLICCGKGNNGGDGFALFRRRELLGIDCRIATFAPFNAYKGDALVNLRIVQAMTRETPEKIFYVDTSSEARQRLADSLEWTDWIVDALLGTGAVGPLRAPYDEVVPLLNAARKPIYAIDVPSGLNADDGSVATDAIKATLTTTLAAMKIGLLKEQAKPYVGDIHVGDVGVPITPLLDD